MIRSILAEALFPLTGLLTAAFLTRRLGPEGYGLLTLAATIVGWVQWCIASLFSRATIKLVGEAKDWRPIGAMMMRLHLVLSGGAAFLLWLSAPPIADLLNEPVLASYLRLFSLEIPVLTLAHMHRNILVGVGSFRPRALASAGHWVARLLLIVLLVELGLSIPGAIFGSIGASLVGLVIGRFYIRPSLLLRSSFPARKLWNDAVPLFFFTLTLTLYSKLDLLALKVMGGTASEAGIYGTAQNLSLLPGLFAGAFSPLLLSTLSRLVNAGEGGLAKEIGRDSMRVVIGLLPFIGMTVGAAPEIISLIFGPLFLPAAPLFTVLIFGALAMVSISVSTTILTAAGKSGWTFVLSAPLVPLAIVGHLLLIPRVGAIGAALVTSLVASIGALAAVIAVYRLWHIHPPLRTVARSVLLFGVAYALSALWPAPGILLLVKLPVIGIVICFLFLLLGEFSASEMALTRSMMRWRAVPQRSVG